MSLGKTAAQRAMKATLAAMAIRIAHKAEDLRPIGDQVLVKADAAAEFQGLIYIPETARKKEFLRTGKVVSVGLGDMLVGGNRRPMNVKPGDHVIYDQASNRVVIFEGEEYIVVHEEQHIIAVIE